MRKKSGANDEKIDFSLLGLGNIYVMIFTLPAHFIWIMALIGSSQLLSYLSAFICVVGLTPLYLTLNCRANPFGEHEWIRKKVSHLSEGERKILTFIHDHPQLKKLAFRVAWFVSSFILIAAILRIRLGQKFYIYEAQEGVKGIIIVGIAAGVMTFLTQLMVIYHYISKHYNEIASSDIEPWPKDKPFAKDWLGRYKADKKYMQEPGFLAYLFDENVANQKATWSGLLFYSVAILALVLMFVNFSFIFDFLRGTFTYSSSRKMYYFLAGLALLVGCQIFWRSKQDK